MPHLVLPIAEDLHELCTNRCSAAMAQLRMLFQKVVPAVRRLFVLVIVFRLPYYVTTARFFADKMLEMVFMIESCDVRASKSFPTGVT